MLIDILKQIFYDNNYVERNVELNSVYKYFLAVPNPKVNRQEYFLVLEKKDTTEENIKSLMTEDADKYFEIIRKNDQVDEAFDKNCTMILCFESTKSEFEVILRLEEDPYNFKKNVIEYTAKELASWNSKVTGTLTVNDMNRLVNPDQGATFTAFKKKTSNDYYSLLMKIFIKLPIINYMPQSPSNLYDISEKIRSSLSKSNLNHLDFINKHEPNMTEDELDELLISDWTVA